MWGNGIDPPADINPHPDLASRISARDQPALQPTAITTRLVSALVVIGLYFGASAPLNRPVQRGLQLGFDTGCVIRTEQMTDPFDRSLLSVPSRAVCERSTAGTSQVSRRSAETGAAPASWKLVYPWPVVAFCSPCADQAGAGCRPAWSVQSDTPISAGFSWVPGDPVGHAWARLPIHQ